MEKEKIQNQIEETNLHIILLSAVIIIEIIIIVGCLISRIYHDYNDIPEYDLPTRNARFERFVGKQKGNEVKNLLQLIRSHNARYEKDDIYYVNSINETYIEKEKIDEIIKTETEKIKDFGSYRITFGYNCEGYIESVQIDEDKDNITNATI